MARNARCGRAGRQLLAIGLTLVACVLVVRLEAGPVSADGEIAIAIADPDDTAFPDVSFVITADRAGRPITLLGAASVAVTEGGQPAVVTSVRRAQDSGIPLSIVMTLDTSGSMQGATMDAAKAAAGALLQRLGPADSAAVVAFSDRAQVVETLTRDRAALQRAVAGLVPAGNTALYDAVAESARLASESGGLRRAVLLFSDGREFGGSSVLTREQALARAAQGGAVFYTVGIGPDIDRAFLDEVATRSGGRSFVASGAGEVPQIYAALEELLRGQFVITARSSAAAAGAARQIKVEVREADGQGAAQRQYTSRRGAASNTEAPAPNVALPVTADAPIAAPRFALEGGGGLRPFALPLGVLLVAVLGVAVSLRRRAWRQLGPTGPVITRRGSAALPRAGGVLRVASGPSEGVYFELAAAPATIGSASDCVVRLASAYDIAPLHARLWWRDGKPMLHHLAHGYQTRVNGQAIDWASLQEGAEIQLGSVTLRFEAAPPAVAIGESRGALTASPGV